MTAPQPLATFDFKKKDFNSPIVYVYFRKKVPLYVGFSKNGLHRPFHPRHDKAAVRRTADHIQVMVFKDEATARHMEAELIYRYAPDYNISAPAGFPQPPAVGAWVYDLKTLWYTTAERLLSGEHDKWVAMQAKIQTKMPQNDWIF